MPNTSPALTATHQAEAKRPEMVEPAQEPTTQSPFAGVWGLQRVIGNQATARAINAHMHGSDGVPPIVQDALRSPGQPLDPATRAFMESRLRHDFSDVCIHADSQAAESAHAVDAKAYTVGQDVVFSEGRYTPHSHEGSKLLAHELAHVIQQERGGGAPPPMRGGALEQHADAAATAFAQGQSVHVQGASAPGLARQPLPGAGEPRKRLREILKLDPQDPNSRQLADDLDLIEDELKFEEGFWGPSYPWGDKVILEKAMELNKITGGKRGSAVLAYYDRLLGEVVMGSLAMAGTPVVTMRDPSGKVVDVVTAVQLAQMHKKMQMDFALGLIQAFAMAGAVGAAGMLAVGLLMLSAAAAPAVFGAYATAEAMTGEAAIALVSRLAPQLMSWAARNPHLALAVVTAVADTALNIIDTGSVDPMQMLVSLLHVQQARLDTRTVAPDVSVPPAATKPTPTYTVSQGSNQGNGKPTGMLFDTDAASRGVQVRADHPVFKNKLPANDTPTPPQGQAAKVAVNATKDLPHGQNIDPAQGPSAARQTSDPARMGKKPPPPDVKQNKNSGPPAAELDPGEGETTKKPRKNRGDADDLPRKQKISDRYDKPELEQSPELIARLPNPSHRRRYMTWLKEGHQGRGHPHINPATNLDGSLEQFSSENGIRLEPKK